MTGFKRFLHEFWLFGLKQAYACLFGGYLIFLMVISKFWYPFSHLHRYDFLFISAVAFQAFLLIFRFESLREAIVIFVFHILATLMELFKTNVGSWSYPEPYLIGVASVPLFAGFMYSAVGSYIARSWRVFEFDFSSYPPQWLMAVLVALIYINFFTHHFIVDLRYFLLVAITIAYWRVDLYFRVKQQQRKMPLMLGLILVALFIWFAENIGTISKTWIYPSQATTWHMVPISKLIAWLLLMMLSFVLVSFVHKPKIFRRH